MPTVTGSITKQPIFPGATSVGLNHVGAYQVSGIPWITASFINSEILSGSIRTFHFPRVAKKIVIQAIPNSWVTANGDGSQIYTSDPIYFFFGEPKTGNGTSKIGDDTFITNYYSPKYTVDATAPPIQYSQGHMFTVTFASSSGGGFETAGNTFTITAKTDHINVAVAAGLTAAATASFQIYAELTNIPSNRMPDDYISGSGVNTL